MQSIFRKKNAKAIWIDNVECKNRYVRFQTEFTADKTDAVSFYICTDTEYELYINGKLAGFSQYEDFPQNKVYNTHDISEFVVCGNNLVSILSYSLGADSQSHLAGVPLIIFAAVCGEKTLLISDTNVKCDEAKEFTSGKIERISFELPYNIGINLNNDDGWRSEKVSEAWNYAVAVNDSEIAYNPRPIANLELGKLYEGKMLTQGIFSVCDGATIAEKMQLAALSYRDANDCFEALKPLTLKKDNLFWINDLEEETVGFITLDIEAEEGAELWIAYGEHLTDMRVRSYIDDRNYAFCVVCRSGRQQIRFLKHRIACRYLEIFAKGGIKKIHTLGLTEVNYPIEYFCELKLNDRLFNQIYKTSLKTLSLCMHSHYEDCPQREQSLYGMDSRNQMLAGYYAFGETKMPRASLALFAQGQKENGLFEICVPGTYDKTIPYFSLAWLCAVNEYVLYSGDVDFVSEMMPHAKKLIHFFEIDNNTHLIKRPRGYEFWNFYEWTSGMSDMLGNDAGLEPLICEDAPINAFYMIALKAYIKLCEYVEDIQEKEWAESIKKEIFNAFHNTFYCNKKQAYVTYIGELEPHFAQLTQAWALCGGCVPEKFKSIIRKSMVESEMVEISLSHCIFKYDALFEDAAQYSDIILSDIEEKWGYMLYNGATSFWETMLGESDFNRAGSLCHGWSATPAYIFWRYIVGITPTKPGFEEYKIKPLCDKSIIAKGKLKTPKGILSVDLSDGITNIN